MKLRVIQNLLCFLMIGGCGCATPRVLVNAVTIHNGSAETLTAIEVVHEPAQQIGSVNVLFPKRSFDLSFAAQPLLGTKGTISWVDSRGRPRSTTVVLPVKTPSSMGRHAWRLVYRFRSGADVTVYLEPSPFGF